MRVTSLVLILALAALVGCDSSASAPVPPGPGVSDWDLSTLDATGRVGRGASLAMVGGMPAISYSDNTNHGARYIRALDVNGNAWAAPVQIASGVLAPAASTALLDIGGAPAVAFQRGNVKFSRALDGTGSSWSPFVAVGSINGMDSISLLNVAGRPTVISRDPKIYLVRADDAVGSSWPGTEVTISGANRPVSAALVDGMPAVAYSTSSDQLAYRRATAADGSTWGAEVLLNDVLFTNFLPSLAVVSGNPAIAWVNNSELRYIRAIDDEGVSWPAAGAVLHSGVALTGQTDLEVILGKPAVAFTKFVGLERHLGYIEASDAFGTSWAAAVGVDESSSVGEFLSLEEVGGQPAIAYFDLTDEDLKFARRKP
jgi:hypothetical protein